MNQLQVFNYGQKEIRTIVVDGETEWIAKDLCEVLDLGNVSQALARLDEDEKGVTSNDTLGGPQEMLTVNESGLYSLILGSKKPEAKPFKRWITHEVLPTIRKTGAYITDAAQPEMLRAKADEMDRMQIINEAARIIMPVMEEAGVKPHYKALLLTKIYGKAGIELPMPQMAVEAETFDRTQIAIAVGAYSQAGNKPHAQLIGRIISTMTLSEDEVELVPYEKNGHMDTVEKYAQSVVDKVRHYLHEVGWPSVVSVGGKNFKMSWKRQVA